MKGGEIVMLEKKLKFFTPAHKEPKTESGYHLKVYESDPYYHVEVFKDGVLVDNHLLTNDEAELEKLVKKYERM
jgi:hypothetical protein